MTNKHKNKTKKCLWNQKETIQTDPTRYFWCTRSCELKKLKI